MSNSNINEIFLQLKKRITLIIIGFVIILIILIIVLPSYLKERQARSNLPEAGVPSSVPNVSNPGILYNLSGTIEKLENNTITFEAIVPHIDQNNQLLSGKETRKAITTSNTTFTRFAMVIHKETGTEIPKESQISFKDLKIGEYIEVLSNQDISKAAEFEVIKVRILPH